MALYLGSARHRVEAPRQNAFLRVQAIFGLVEHHRLRAVDHLVGDFVAAMRGQAMHEQRVGFRQRHQLGVDLIRFQQIVTVLAVLVAHREPGVGDHAIGVTHGGLRIVAEHDRRLRRLDPVPHRFVRRELRRSCDVEIETETLRRVRP